MTREWHKEKRGKRIIKTEGGHREQKDLKRRNRKRKT
jgi:hypothetical protein